MDNKNDNNEQCDNSDNGDNGLSINDRDRGAPTGAPDLAPRETAALLLRCADAWDAEARLLGNVRARDIAALCRATLTVPGATDAISDEHTAEIERLLAVRNDQTQEMAPRDDAAFALADRASWLLSQLAARDAENARLRATNEQLTRIADQRTRDADRGRTVHLARHRRLSEALGMDPGYSADATIDAAVAVAKECDGLRADAARWRTIRPSLGVDRRWWAGRLGFAPRHIAYVKLSGGRFFDESLEPIPSDVEDIVDGVAALGRAVERAPEWDMAPSNIAQLLAARAAAADARPKRATGQDSRRKENGQ